MELHLKETKTNWKCSQQPTLENFEQKINEILLDGKPKYKRNIHESMLMQRHG